MESPSHLTPISPSPVVPEFTHDRRSCLPSKSILFDFISLHLCPDFNLYFCHIHNGEDNRFASPVIASSEDFSTQHETSSCPIPKPRARLSHSSLSCMVSPKKTGSKKMSCFLILNIKVTEIKDILVSRIYDELWEDKR